MSGKIIIKRHIRNTENIKALFGKCENKSPTIMEIRIAALKDGWPEKIVKKMKKPELPKIEWIGKQRVWVRVEEESHTNEMYKKHKTQDEPEKDATEDEPEKDATEDEPEKDATEDEPEEEGFDIDEFEDEDEEEENEVWDAPEEGQE
jgi:hypothetical protein